MCVRSTQVSVDSRDPLSVTGPFPPLGPPTTLDPSPTKGPRGPRPGPPFQVGLYIPRHPSRRESGLRSRPSLRGPKPLKDPPTSYRDPREVYSDVPLRRPRPSSSPTPVSQAETAGPDED